MSPDQFLQWEKSARSIDFKPEYVDVAGGDLNAGVLLSQIVYWHLPSKKSATRLRIEKQGRLWIGKTRREWWMECRLTESKFDRAARILAQAGLIEVRRFRYKGSPTLHISLNTETFLARLQQIISTPELPF